MQSAFSGEVKRKYPRRFADRGGRDRAPLGSAEVIFSVAVVQNGHREFDWKKFFLSNAYAPTLAFWLRDSEIGALGLTIREIFHHLAKRL